MELVQFEIPGAGRHVGVLEGDVVHDVTARRANLRFVVDLLEAAVRANLRLEAFLKSVLASGPAATLGWESLWRAAPAGAEPFLHCPLDHPDPHYVLVSGTGLSHIGSMQSRDQMHRAGAVPDEGAKAQEPATDSARMFARGLEGGKPAAGVRGEAPEWFYKGDGGILRAHRAPLEVPAFALDGGEEPEIVGCYVIDAAGRPRRMGFALGNEWSDHATEKISYLHLAPSKLRTCAMGPTLNTHSDFQDISLRCSVVRRGNKIYDSGELKSGERWMCHSLRNLEDHHFKYPQHRRPGDVHLHFFGTSRLSFGTRQWKFEADDEIRIEAPGFSPTLVNRVALVRPTIAEPIVVAPA
ncbi:MAG TPA: AraD1 family protein [Planctomycetaceae bacterium]|nr:AraD1 family protein [Planctomycetaceae bacterium]